MSPPTGPDVRRTGTKHAQEHAGSESGARVIDLADPGWCWSRLRSTGHGVLSSPSSPTGSDAEVSYTVVGEQVVVPVLWDGEALHLHAGHDVTLSLAGRGEDGNRWVVRATGTAELAVLSPDHGAAAERRGGHPARGVSSEGGATLLLPVRRLRGYHETPLEGLDDGRAPEIPDGTSWTPPATTTA